jgi:hypothetical protein
VRCRSSSPRPARPSRSDRRALVRGAARLIATGEVAAFFTTSRRPLQHRRQPLLVRDARPRGPPRSAIASSTAQGVRAFACSSACGRRVCERRTDRDANGLAAAARVPWRGWQSATRAASELVLSGVTMTLPMPRRRSSSGVALLLGRRRVLDHAGRFCRVRARCAGSTSRSRASRRRRSVATRWEERIADGAHRRGIVAWCDDACSGGASGEFSAASRARRNTRAVRCCRKPARIKSSRPSWYGCCPSSSHAARRRALPDPMPETQP